MSLACLAAWLEGNGLAAYRILNTYAKYKKVNGKQDFIVIKRLKWLHEICLTISETANDQMHTPFAWYLLLFVQNVNEEIM